MAGVQGGEFARKVINRLNDVAKDRGSKMAKQWGDPINGEQLSKDEQARLWNLSNPNADPAQVQQLIAAGQHSQAVDAMFPWRNTLIGKGDLKTRIQRAQQLSDLAAGQGDQMDANA